MKKQKIIEKLKNEPFYKKYFEDGVEDSDNNRAALISIVIDNLKEHYYLVEKDKVEVVEVGTKMQIGDLLQGKNLYAQVVDMFVMDNEENYIGYKLVGRNGKPAIPKEHIL